MKKTILIATFTLMLGACAPTGSSAAGGSTSAESAAKAIASAEAAREKVAKVGYEWRDTGGIIDDAKKAAEDKDYDKAAKLAAKAKYQSVAAMEQYKSQKNAHKTR